MFVTGSFNDHSQYWWSDGDTIPEGRKLDEITSKHELIQLINEPTNFELKKTLYVLIY